MNKTFITTFALLAAMGGAVQAQTVAPVNTPPADPIVQMRTDKRDANAVFNEATAAARKERDTKVQAAVDAAVKDAKANGKDPLVAQRAARSKARAETRPAYDAAVKAATAERNATRAAARKAAGPAIKP